eukprot:TRINITY_DN10418_c0_g1_i1.p1 TRINITY_DN10418_c0_g1~~TRINITY_DN10418_c0_g1_i1.p1  ORF type:complete len:333 (+),score=8.86 TRINITY_DN10418_c0_g1_i1:3-1001(+)
MENSKVISLKEFILSTSKTLSSAILNKDTDHKIFHGCYDWHSAVHGHWAILRIYNYRENFDFFSSITNDEKSALEKSADLVAHRLFDNKNGTNISKECKTLLKNPQFEFPYGRSWLLRLAIEFKAYCKKINSEQYQKITNMADDVAKLMLKQYNEDGVVDILAPEYANPSWALAQMFDFFNDNNQPHLAAQVSDIVKKYYLGDGNSTRASFIQDHRLPYFFSGFGNMAYVVLKTQREEDITAFLNKYKKEVNSELLAPIKLRQNSQIHHFGTNWSRIWAINAIKNTINSLQLADLSDLNTMLDQARDKHAEEALKCIIISASLQRTQVTRRT